MQSSFTNRLLDNVRTRLVEAQKQILRTCARKDIPIVVLEYWNHKDTINEISRELRLIPRVRFILKRNWDGFQATILNEVLNGFKAESLLFMGVYASGCVLSTASTAVNLGYNIFTSEDLIAEFPPGALDIKTRRWLLQNGHLQQNANACSFV